jgi:exodeoxyribonuclease VII large subunit
LTVSEVTRRIKALLLKDSGLQDLYIVGEVSDSRPSGTGHIYFNLKDRGAVISCVMWRSRAVSLKFKLEDGLKVIVKGSIGLYEKSGRYQVHVDTLRPEGMGALHLAFEQLRKRLEAEGLFQEARKRPIPPYPSKVGVVTSPTGAALQDIIRVATKRWPLSHIIVSPASVQGDASAYELVHAIHNLNSMAEVDVMIVSRGGGSLEDLWSFNEEVVARAIAGSDIPVVTGIGHEVDRTIADYVADLAAATPSQAAELVFPDAHELKARLDNMDSLLASRLRSLVRYSRERLNLLKRSRALTRPRDIVDQLRQSLDDTIEAMSGAMSSLVQRKRQGLAVTTASLSPLDPRAILARGYSITMDKDDRVVKDPEMVQEGDIVRILVHRGEITGRVESRRRGEDDGEE